MNTIDWPPTRPPRPPRRRGRLILLALLAAVFFGGATALSYYVDALWFSSLGFIDVFWTTLSFQLLTFLFFLIATFAILYGSFRLLKPDRFGEISSGPIIINGQPISIPVEPAFSLIAAGLVLFVAVITGLGMTASWSTFALYWYGGSIPSPEIDPIFGRGLSFYFFTLPSWQLIAGWLMTLSVIVLAIAIFFAAVGGGTRLIARRVGHDVSLLRGVSASVAFVLLMLAVQVYLGRFERIFADHTIFAGVTYTEAHVSIPGTWAIIVALLAGAAAALVNAAAAPKLRWLGAAVVPAIACYIVVNVSAWYVNSFIVKPNELVRESPFIAHNIELTRKAYALDRITEQPFPADSGLEAVDAANNQQTFENIRLWDWRALQDTLRQIQEIRTYYDFPDIDIDRYEIEGARRQVMLATRELNVERLPESSRNWINEKLVYTHGYGITMNRVNGFTPEGLPLLLLGNMPVQSMLPNLDITRPEIYFGELTNGDVYVKTRQKEFNYPQGETNNLTSYEGTGGIAIGGFLRRLLIAIDRGDLAKLPFSDDVTADSRLLMRRNVMERVRTVAPFLTLDPDPYMVVGENGRLFWIVDAFTTAETYPYSRHYRVNNDLINYMRNSVKVVIDAYNGSVTLYVFDADDPVVTAYRRLFPTLFTDAAAMPAALRQHVRYPELLLELQAAAYGLYHMSDPAVFYNREDLWTVASEVSMTGERQQGAQPMEPNFVLMKLPGERDMEFVEILPFTPANRNNLIAWIAGRSDEPHYGTAAVYNFPKTKLVDGPLQIEARIDQNAQLSGQLSLWNQQGSHVRRGSLIVIPVGRALLYAEPIYLQAERSPMPELRIVVLALQDRLAYGPNFETAMAALFGNGPSTLSTTPSAASAAPPEEPRGPQAAPAPASTDRNSLIAGAARDLEEYQRLTAEGRLGEAGQKLQALKEKLGTLQSQQR